MLSNLFIVAAVAVLSMALRTYRTPYLRRLGTVGVFVTSFLAGWLIGGHWLLGVAFASTWLLLPWLEILTRVRKLRLPIERVLEESQPPTREDFPNLNEVTDEIEAAGFHQVDDLGWNYENQRQFYRLFYQSESHTEAALCFVEQDGLAFYYTSVTSRTPDGEVYLTWTYPFSYGLRLVPTLHLQRLEPSASFSKVLADHRYFLDARRVGLDAVQAQTPESIREHIQSDLRRQISHNLDLGLLSRVGEDRIRYSARGMLFLWVQFLRDLVRLS